MDNPTLIIVLALFTLCAAVGIGLWQRARVKKAADEQRESAFNKTPGHGELR